MSDIASGPAAVEVGRSDDSAPVEDRSRGYHVEILLIAFSSLLLEIAYTRIISFKLFYYYTYLVIGLALLGIGCGGVLMAVSGRLKKTSTDSILMFGSLLGAASVALGYLVVARIGIASLSIWEYGEQASFSSFGRLIAICLALFVSFVAVGVMLAALFGRRSEGIGKLYFADLLGAGLACFVAVFLISSIGPPGIIILGGAILAGVGTWVAVRVHSKLVPVGAVLSVVLAIGVVFSSILPDVRLDDGKADASGAQSSHWSPIFRVDAADVAPEASLNIPRKLLLHDGALGSVIQQWDGRTESLGDFQFDRDPRSFPFDVMDRDGTDVMIIGAAGGHEILASLYYDADKIDAIELNPATHRMLTEEYADYAGHLAEQPGVNYVNGDGRSFLARDEDKSYDLIWYPAPDSYSATNASTAGAFVLSESYLYTSEAIEESLDHVSDNGIVAAQFGEIDFTDKPNRTLRYVNTARQALENHGVENPADHILVSSTDDLSTVLVKKSPFTDEEIARFEALEAAVPGTVLRYVPGNASDERFDAVLTMSEEGREQYLESYPYDVSPINDNGPFFWHFATFGKVIDHYGEAIDGTRDGTEDSVGERVLLLLLAIATVMAAVFLLLPFVAVRKTWTKLPRKGTSAIYFASLGLGFMFFEITLIQRLTLFLGFPTYSLTVTLASLLIFTGVGALLSNRFKDDITLGVKILAPAIIVLGAVYLLLLPVMTDALLATPLAVRVLFTFVVLAPLGICLGMFMPLGIGAVAALTDHGAEYVAWGWAVNGFASVIGSVLTTLIAMSFGFNVVLVLAVVVYLVAMATLWRLRRPVVGTVDSQPDDVEPVAVGALTG